MKKLLSWNPNVLNCFILEAWMKTSTPPYTNLSYRRTVKAQTSLCSAQARQSLRWSQSIDVLVDEVSGKSNKR